MAPVFTVTSRTPSTANGILLWNSIASSSDGTKLAAIRWTYGNSRIFTSTDAGASWTERNISSTSLNYIASSADGTTLVVCSADGIIYKSTNSGVTWSELSSFNYVYFIGIAISGDGQVILATCSKNGASDGLIRISRDGGQNWVTIGNEAEHISPVMSSDGQHMAFINQDDGKVYISHDTGETWNSVGDVRAWRSVTISDDGQKLVVVGNGTYIYTTTDGGQTWIPHLDDAYRVWASISGSRDGSKLVAVIGNRWNNTSGDIYTSVDFGQTWVPRNTVNVWISSTSSYDGNKVAFIGEIPQIYTGVWSS